MTESSNITSPSFYYKPSRFLIVSLFVISGITIAVNYNSLEPNIPVLFNYPLAENGMGSKQSLWELLIFFSVIAVIFLSIRRAPFVNHSFAFPPVRKEVALKIGFELFGLLALVCAISCLSVVAVTINQAKGNILDGNSLLYPALPMVLIGIPLVYLLRYAILKK